MSDTPNQRGMSRRDAMMFAIALVGGGAGLSACSDNKGPFFSSTRMVLLDEVCQLIIPTTDTPGAREAGVPAFIDSMMVNWASDETKDQIKDVIDGIDEKARADADSRFMSLEPAQRFDILKQYDAQALAEDGHPYRRFKELVLVGYYLSEIGATQELHYELVPGRWQADLPLSEVGRTWAT